MTESTVRTLDIAVIGGDGIGPEVVAEGLKVLEAVTASAGPKIYTTEYEEGDVLKVHIAHGMGNFVADGDVLEELEGENRVIFRYVDMEGFETDEANPNGSAHNIAGIINEAGNVLGLMPHPERSVEGILGSTDGLGLFESLVAAKAPLVGLGAR